MVGLRRVQSICQINVAGPANLPSVGAPRRLRPQLDDPYPRDEEGNQHGAEDGHRAVDVDRRHPAQRAVLDDVRAGRPGLDAETTALALLAVPVVAAAATDAAGHPGRG